MSRAKTKVFPHFAPSLHNIARRIENPKYKTSKAQITRVVVMHSLADCIETYATDLNLRPLVDLCAEIRKEGNRYGDEFVNISEYLEFRISEYNYNIQELLPVLCFALYCESVKIQSDFLRENKEYIQMETAKKIRDYFKGEFMSKEMISNIKNLIIDIRQNNFYE